MKRIFAILIFVLSMLLITGAISFADEAATSTEASTGVTVTATNPVLTTEATTTDAGSTTKAGLLAIGQDNIYAWIPGDGAFLAIGGGFDILSWERNIGSKGGKLNLTLHGTAAARVTGNDSSAIVGGSVNVDLIKLLNGTGVNFLLDNFKCVIGPIVIYDANKGKMGYGGLLNFSYTTD